jgi:hypothetical protein
MGSDQSEDTQSQVEQPQAYDPNLVQQAKDMGWVDKTEWKGHPDHWRGPDEYVRRGQEVLPIVRAQLERVKTEQQKREEEHNHQRRDLEDRLRRQEDAEKAFQARLEAQQREFADRTERNDKMARIALERQRQTFLEQIDAAKYNAVAAGDQQTYAGLIERERQFYRDIQREDEQYKPKEKETPRAERTETVSQAQVPGLTPRDQRVRDEWMEKNPWFHRSPELNTEAQRIHMELWEKVPGLDLAENLERVTNELKKKYPEKFGLEPNSTSVVDNRAQTQTSAIPQVPMNQGNGGGRGNEGNGYAQTSQHSFVEGSSSGSASGGYSSRKKGWSDIHPDDRALAEKSYINTGFYGKDTQKAREAYATDYWSEYGD